MKNKIFLILTAVIWMISCITAAQSCEDGSFSLNPSFEDNFNYNWENNTTDWRIATWMQNGTQMAKERCSTNTKGHMIQTVLPGIPYRGGSVQTTREFGYGKWVASVKPSSVPGVLNSIFIKDWDDLTTATSDSDGTHFEVDIEFLTYTFGPDTGSVHLAIHRKDEFNAYSTDLGLDFNPSDEFHEWGFEVYKNCINWTLDGNILHTWYPEEGYTIPANYEFFFNSWTKDTWINGPPEDTAYYHINKLEFFESQSETTDINEINENNINIYPNPFSDIINFRGNLQNKRLEIFNANGEMIMEIDLDEDHLLPVNLSEMPGGIYFVTISAGDGRILQKNKAIKLD